MTRRPPVLTISGLHVDYGTGPAAVHALRDIDLTLHRGEILGLAGESGSGKSTLAYAVTRLLSPPGVITGGDVHYHPPQEGADPVDLLSLTPRQLRAFRWQELSIVFQGSMNSLNPVHTVHSQLTDVLATHRPRMTSPQRTARAAELLALVGISRDRLGAFPHQLSGGMRQRVMIAMAMALEPEIVVMDEPTTALDVVMQRQILRKIAALREELDFSVVFITHDISLLIEFSDRVAIMYGGRIVEQANAADVYRDPQHPYSDGLLHSFPALHGPRRELTGIPGSPPHLAAMPSGCAFHPRCGKSFEPCARHVPALTAPGSTTDRTVACWLHQLTALPPSGTGTAMHSP